MEVFKVSIYYTVPQGIKIVNLAAACPTGEHLNDRKDATARLETYWSLVSNRRRNFR